MGSSVRIAMVAGEASGDLFGQPFDGCAQGEVAGCGFYGIGGPKMQALGFDAWWPMEKLAVMGYVDALKHYREISGIRRQLKNVCLIFGRISSSGSMRLISISGWKPI